MRGLSSDAVYLRISEISFPARARASRDVGGGINSEFNRFDYFDRVTIHTLCTLDAQPLTSGNVVFVVAVGKRRVALESFQGGNISFYPADDVVARC